MDSPKQNQPVAYEADQSIRKMLGDSTPLNQIFTPEKIAACENHIKEAQLNFFDITKNDMDIIAQKINATKLEGNLKTLYADIFKPLSNIKGQAEVFAFPLIKTICKYLMDYCEQSRSGKSLTPTESFVVEKLFQALDHCLKQHITDHDGALEKELESIIAASKK